jgi:hypothetical protein
MAVYCGRSVVQFSRSATFRGSSAVFARTSAPGTVPVLNCRTDIRHQASRALRAASRKQGHCSIRGSNGSVLGLGTGLGTLSPTLPPSPCIEQGDAKGLPAEHVVQYLCRIFDPSVSRQQGAHAPSVLQLIRLLYAVTATSFHLITVCKLFLDCSTTAELTLINCSTTASLYYSKELACIKASLSREDHECAPRGVSSFHLATLV